MVWIALLSSSVQEPPAGGAHVVLQWVWPKLWLNHQLTSGEAALLVKVATVTASLAAQDPQLTPDGAAPLALVEGKHRQAPYWAALVTSVPLGY